MHDGKLIASAIAARGAYERIARHVGDKDLSPQAMFWWKLVADWYKHDPEARAVDRDLLASAGKRNIKNPKHEDLLLAYLRDLPEIPSAYNVAQELLEIKRRNAELEYAAAVAENAPYEKRVKLHRIAGEMLAKADLDDNALEAANDDAEMLRITARKNKIPIAPSKLTERTGGGAMPGDHIVVFGRPECGKSLFAVNMAAGFLRQGRRVLYIGNEESVYKTRHRILCNLSRMTGHHVERDTAQALKLARERGLSLLDTRQGHPGSIQQIDDLMDQLKPDVLVLDQIRNLESVGLDKASLTHRLEHLAIEVRNLLSKYHAIGVSVSQAGDKTERHGQAPPAWLQMADVDSSRTGLPAQADLLLGIGSDSSMRAANERAVSICKNKLAHNHDGFIVEVDLLRSIVR